MSEINNKGYYLNKTGDRVNDLLSRHFIVPTINKIPDETTTQWEDGDYIVTFRIGEFVRVELNNDYTFYRLKDIKEGKAIWINVQEFDVSDFYTKEEVEDKISNSVKDKADKATTLSGYNIDDAYTKQQIDKKLSELIIPGGGGSGGVEILTPEEYEEKKNSDSIVSNMVYLLLVDGDPFELYIGTILIGKKGDLENMQFPYIFPIIF